MWDSLAGQNLTPLFQVRVWPVRLVQTVRLQVKIENFTLLGCRKFIVRVNDIHMLYIKGKVIVHKHFNMAKFSNEAFLVQKTHNLCYNMHIHKHVSEGI